jgi:hypothetical protein
LGDKKGKRYEKESKKQKLVTIPLTWCDPTGGREKKEM